jgi:hypothetical protein
MSHSPSPTWLDANQRYLVAALAELRVLLQHHRTHTEDSARGERAAESMQHEPAQRLASLMSEPPALEMLRKTFGLSPFERDLLLLCAAVELDASFDALHTTLPGSSQRGPTFGLALTTLPDAHWSALTPIAPLRYWRLIDVDAGSKLTQSALRIDERILHYLVGVPYLDRRLVDIVKPVPPVGELVQSHAKVAERIAEIWSCTAREVQPAIQLSGTSKTDKRTAVVAGCARLGLNLYILAAHALPLNPTEIGTLLRLWEREAVLSRSALLLECDELDPADSSRTNAVQQFVEQCSALLCVSALDPQAFDRSTITIDVQKPRHEEQRAVWQAALGRAASKLNGQVDLLVSQFNLSAQAIKSVSSDALSGLELTDDTDLHNVLWDACRIQARPHLDDLAQHIDSITTWDDLVLPTPQRQILRDIAAHVRHRSTVYEQWGFAAKGSRGLGISAMFAGVSGTGKTLAAEVLAHELRLDLYRIDLSSVVSKYIGETEKNLRRIFDAAEEGGAILLFDEADALFGKRSEVKDSHDRYANIEVSYLLQRIECYQGLAILTTNLKSALDTAFLRRIRFIVQFPFPDAVQRAEIWRRIFPRDTPTEALNIDQLSRLNITGGNIRNIALNAAFLAADSAQPVRMSHLLRAARSEYAKLEKSLTEAETAGWIELQL